MQLFDLIPLEYESPVALHTARHIYSDFYGR